MLPQMMPLPWLFIFFLIFICVFSVSLYFNFFSFDTFVAKKCFNSHSYSLPW